jgi:hypothetical protein
MDTDEVCQVLFHTLTALISSPSVGMPRIELRSPAPVLSSGDDAVAAAASSRRQ